MNAEMDLLNWPKTAPIDIWVLILIIVFVLALFILLLYYQKRNAARNQMWIMLRQHIKKRGLNPTEIRILKDFFNSLSKKESADLFLNPLSFYRKLYKWFANTSGIDSHLEVRVLDKLFSTFFSTGPVSSISNLRSGEACSIELENGSHHLGKIISAKKGEFFLSVPDIEKGHKKGFKINQKIHLYVFRPNHGVYRLHGLLSHLWKDGISFAFDGKISHQGIAHYMCIIELDCKLTPWPQKSTIGKSEPKTTNESDSENKPISSMMDASNKPIDVENEFDNPEENDIESIPIVIHGKTSRVSDRALIFYSDEENSQTVINQSKVWELELKLPDGYLLKCKGKFVQAQAEQSKFLFKYLDISENSQKILFSMIKENKPVREKLL